MAMTQRWKLASAAVMALSVNLAYADTATDEKITQLQKLLEAQQAQMQALAEELKALRASSAVSGSTSPMGDVKLEQEQQWQIQAMSDELKALQQRPTVIANEKDGLGFKSSNGDFSIKLHGLVQADYRGIDDGTAGTSSTSDGWMVRKARPWIEGTLFGWVDYRLTPEFATITSNVATSSNSTSVSGRTTLGTPEVIDAFFDAKFQPWLRLRAGKFKPFVGLARLQSDVDGKFLEHSFVTANLLPQRDVGVSVFGDLFDGKLSYAVGYSNGVIDGGDQSVALDNNKDKEVTARIFVQPFKGDGSMLAGLGFGLAGTSINQLGSTTNTQLPSFKSFSQNSFFSYSGNTAGTTTGATYADGRRCRFAPQAYYYYGPFGVMAEYAREDQEVTRSTHHETLSHDAWQATFSYVLTGEEASYSSVKPRQPFNPDSGGWGAWELVARLSRMDIDDDVFIGRNSAAASNAIFANISTSVREAKAWGVGVNWYVNNFMRFALDYEKTSFEGGGGGTIAANANVTAATVSHWADRQEERAMIGRLQVSF